MNNLPLPVKILIVVVICLSIGGTSGIVTSSAINDWYVTLNKPSFNPPNWIFAPVWTLLYIMMGLAAALIWQEGWEKKIVKMALLFFSIQLVLNALWSIVFFGWKQPAFALIEIFILWSMLLVCIIKFKAIKPLAAYLLIPYFLWVTFASILNGAIWWLN